MSGLFDSLDEARRQRLRQRGWKLVGAWGGWHWERPDDKACFSEAEAFAQLSRLEKDRDPEEK